MKGTKIFLVLILLAMVFSPLASSEVLVDHVENFLGVSLKIPVSWEEKSFTRGQTAFFPTPVEGNFVMVTLLGPQNEDDSSVDLDFSLSDWLWATHEKIKDLSYHSTKLSGLPAYELEFTLSEEKIFHVHMFFTSANEKIYMIRYQSLEENFDEYDNLFRHEIVPSFRILVIQTSEEKYGFHEVPEYGFSFYYPSSWRVVLKNEIERAMPVYLDPNPANNLYLASTAQESSLNVQRMAYSEGIVTGKVVSTDIQPDPYSILEVVIFDIGYRYEPADLIEGFVHSIRTGAKKELNGFQHLRMLPIEIGGHLAMEYVYTYEDEGREYKEAVLKRSRKLADLWSIRFYSKELYRNLAIAYSDFYKLRQKKTIYVAQYITFANDRVYQILFAGPEKSFSKHIKEVERLLKHFRFRS
ncbi:MAG: hypothetical protein HYS07_06365 [Chlamydiae bacterium]|nr:hypothetical protein [Chlamydiota bacterium]MBI3276545.1 hypothetical protein [Chlamydiota bacterium]